MKSNLAVKLQVNLASLLENLGHAFSKPLTVVSELLQNARRAGATKVTVNYDADAKTLVVEDDGCGITDFQNLLTVAESGWDEEIKESECPYGMGFLASLYACEQIEAQSICGAVKFTTKYALQCGEIPIATGSPIEKGTVITLNGFKAEMSKEKIRDMVKGFPLPVIFNGEDIPRPHALAHLETTRTSIGSINAIGIHRCEPGNHAKNTTAYLLGFAVYSTYQVGQGDRQNVVHLDPRKLSARLPDRECLCDPEKGAKRIEAEIVSVWRQHLKIKAKELSAEAFLATYEDAALGFHKELFNEIPILPRRITARMQEAPVQGDNNYGIISNVSKNMVESGEVHLCERMAHIYEENVVAAMFAYLGDFIAVNMGCLDKNHWAWPYTRDLESESFEIEITGEKANGNYCGGWTSGDVVLCDNYTIEALEDSLTSIHGPRTVDSSTEPIMGYIEGSGNNTFIFPGESCDGRVVLQSSHYEDENDRFVEGDFEKDSEELSMIVRQLRGASAEDIMRDLLSDIYWRKYDKLHGKTFVLHFSSNGEISVEEAVDATSQPQADKG